MLNCPRPVDLNLLKVKLPLPALVSILHRVSGALLFLLLPVLLYGLQVSLSSAQGFAQWQAGLQSPLSKLGLLTLIWAYLHHFCMGLRYLALDFDRGVKLVQARWSAKLVLVISLTLTLLIGLRLW
ncbi:MAG: succinate dehydrogenase, cytochrome b556 subunit [Sulfuriferula sp.]|nr:succinate dehydrogenase, cytochrome b556 subunit [Sulfuriferula sp.]